MKPCNEKSLKLLNVFWVWELFAFICRFDKGDSAEQSKKITRSEKTGIMAVGSEVIWIDFPFAGGILRNGAVAVAFDFSASGNNKKKQRRHNQSDGAN